MVTFVLITILIFFMIGSYVIINGAINVADKVKRKYTKRKGKQTSYPTIYYLPKND